MAEWTNNNLICELIKFIKDNITAVVVVVGWLITHKFTINSEIRNGKQKAYENAVEIFWELYTKALSPDPYSAEEYYKIMSPLQKIEVWATEKILKQSYELTNAIQVLNDAEGTRLEEQKNVQKEMNIFINMIRKDLKLKVVEETNPLFKHLQ